MDISRLVSRHAQFRGGYNAFLFEGKTWTWEEVNQEVNRVANALLAAGLQKGDKLATVLNNSAEFAWLYLAVAKTGMVIVPCSPLLQGPGLRGLIHNSDSRLVVADPQFTEILAGIAGDLPHVMPGGLVIRQLEACDQDELRSWTDLIKEADVTEPPQVDIKGNDLFNIMYSSGTTGEPKGIEHSHEIRANYGTLFALAWRMTPESVALHAGSMVFNGVMLDFMPWQVLGCKYILHPGFDAAKMIADVVAHKVTHLVLVPAQIIAIMNHADYAPEKFASLEMLHNVGAPLPVEYKARINNEMPGTFYELYGMTEGFMTILDKTDSKRKEGSVGCAPPFMEVCVLDENDQPVPSGTVGEICGKSPLLMPGYYKRPDLTAKAIRNGWLHSGDAGYMDDDGYIWLAGRIKDMIISGGVNVYPKDIEEVIAQHDAVHEVAVVGLADDKWGEVPVAAILLKEGQSVDEDELVVWTNERVSAKYQRIHQVVIMADFPRNAAGKTLKREIRDMLPGNQA